MAYSTQHSTSRECVSDDLPADCAGSGRSGSLSENFGVLLSLLSGVKHIG